jgi:predicted lactoylglutathione lyase
MGHKLFVNIAVEDLDRSVEFFTKLGFRFNAQFTDETTTCMLVGEDAYFMLLTTSRFAGFTDHELVDSTTHTEAFFAISCDNREAVDEMVRVAAASGGSVIGEVEDMGFMYSHSFADPDGHQWGPFWMDPAAVEAENVTGQAA